MSGLPGTAHALQAAVKRGDISATEITTAYLTRIDELNPSLGAYTEVTRDRALREARAIDGTRSAGETLPPSPAYRSR